MSSTEVAQYKYAQDLYGLPLLNASFKHQCFSRHVHEGYCVGVIDDGAQRFFRSGANHIASEHCIILVNPDQVHDGHSASEGGWKYRAMYPLPHLMQKVQQEITKKPLETAGFNHPVVSDRYMANQLRGLFNILQHSDNTLQRESLFMHVMSELLQRHAQGSFSLNNIGYEPNAVKRLREYLDCHYAQNISTDTLAQLVGLNPFYLNRLFQKHVGMPPHAYQIQQRLRKAKYMLEDGHSLLNTAMACGFSDQSHLTRHFKKWLGVTPGKFQRNIA